MDTAETKKALYKEKPQATFVGATATATMYEAECSTGRVLFNIPVPECTDSMFAREPQEAQLLIRWVYSVS